MTSLDGHLPHAQIYWLVDTRQFNQTPVFEHCSEPHTSPSLATIAAGCPSELQRCTTQNAPTPSSIQTSPPDANTQPGNAQHTTTFPLWGPLKHSTIPPQRCQLPLPKTKRSHDSVGSMSIPSPSPFFFFFFGGGCYTVLSKGRTE